jgi:outer membrane immunogenic protein
MKTNGKKVSRWMIVGSLALGIGGLIPRCTVAALPQGDSQKPASEQKSLEQVAGKNVVLMAAPEAAPAAKAKPAPAPSGGSSGSWTGFYVGGFLGAGKGTSDAATTTIFSPTGYFATTSPGAIAIAGVEHPSPIGLLAGGDAGYNFQRNNWVLGVETDIGASHLGGSQTKTGIYPCCAPTSFTVHQSVNTEWLFTARGRVGGIVGGSTLLYFTGGVAMSDANYQALFTDTFATAHENAGIKKTLTGWTVGGGAEFKLEEHLTFKLEYLYAHFGDLGTTTSTNLTAFTPPIAFPTNVFTHSSSALITHSARMGFNYRF